MPRLSRRSRDGNGARQQAPIASFLEAGCGFGGSCLPKDVSALVAHGNARGLDMGLLREVMTINRRRPGRVIEALQRGLGTLRGKRVAVLGLAFKPDTDDVRESPAFPIIRALVDAGASVIAYDPVAIEPTRRALAGVPVQYAGSMKEAVAGADAVAVVTRWKEFAALPDVIAEMEPAATRIRRAENARSRGIRALRRDRFVIGGASRRAGPGVRK